MSMDQTNAEVMEELAGLAMVADLGDDVSLAYLDASLCALLDTLEPDTDATIRERIKSIRKCVVQIRGRVCDDPQAVLDDVQEQVGKLQALLAAPPSNQADGQTPSSNAELVLPDWVDDTTFQEFASGRQIVLEDIETDILALADGNEAALASLRRRIHTLKGEAGVLGLSEVEQVCHRVEDFIESNPRGSELVDQLLSVKDWLAGALDAYAVRRRPGTAATDILAALSDSMGKSQDSETEERPPSAPRTPPDASEPGAERGLKVAGTTAAVLQPLDWDEDIRTVAAEFLDESHEGITQVDAILLDADQHGVTKDQVDATFRVFHTIKGVAGFLELAELTELAHTAETLLDQARKGEISIAGAVLDLLFDATEMMRKMLADLRIAISSGLQPVSQPGLSDLILRLKCTIQGNVHEEMLPKAEPGERLGEILSKPSAGVAPAAIQEALEVQKGSGRRLGDELLARGAAEPKQISRGLRAQSRAASEGTPVAKLKEVVKVDLERVDNLVSLIGELVIVEAMITNAAELRGQTSPWLRKHLNQMTKITSDLQDIGTRMRMVPVRGVFQKMARMVRDLSRKSGKEIGTEMQGENTEVDRSMVEQIADPLVHMIRNAVDHGIEDGGTRATVNKSQRGTISLRAFHQGGSVVIEVADDGRGLDRDAILAKARDRGVLKEGDNPSDSEIYNLIFAPGFSTAKQVTEISGRGVGMDVVRRNIESIRGRVKIDSVPGQGSRFTILLPLTLAIIDGMLINCGPERYIIPTLSVVESIRPEKSMVYSVTGRGELVSVRGETLPLFRLDRLLHIEGAVQDPAGALVVVVESHGRKIGILVDEVLTQQQVVIKGLGEGLPNTQYLSGAAIMSDGLVGLILNTDEIADLVDQNTFRTQRGKLLPAPEVAHATAM